MKQVSGAELIISKFLENKTKIVFIFPGGTIAPLLDIIEKRTKITIFCPKNEQGAGYAALAYAKLTKKPSIFMVTSGPGATNAVTPIADAYFDNVPMVVITGQVATSDMRGTYPVRQRGFQEIDTVAMMKPIAKAVFLAEKTEYLPELFEEAFYIAQEGRPGPVVIDLPMNVQRNLINLTSVKTSEPITKNPPKIDTVKLDQLAKSIQDSKMPIILAGGGVISAGAQKQLRTLSKKFGIPVTMSLPGIGSIPTDDKLSLGLCGYAGSQYANLAIFNSDLLIALGTTLHLRQTGSIAEKTAPNAKIVRIDIDPNELNFSRVPTDLTIHADVKDSLIILNNLTSKHHPAKNQNKDWLEQINTWRKQFPLDYKKNSSLKPQYIIELSNQITQNANNLIVTTGVGQHQIWVPRHFSFDFPKRTLLTSSGHGTMGFDLPAAIGAKVASPNSQVLCFVGDGSLQMNIQELATINELKLDIKIIVLDNKSLNIVAQFQRQVWKTDPSTGNKFNPDFVKIAQAYGIPGYHIRKNEQAKTVLKTALLKKGACLIQCHVDPKEDLLPMLLGGHTLDDMTFESSF